MTDHQWNDGMLAVAACGVLACALARPAWADPDEAWLRRAPLPPEIRPLLVLVLDTSAAMAERIETVARYDPLFDYATGSATTPGCDSGRVYWRRGPGPAPDCRTMTGLALEPTTASAGLHCAAARTALERHGIFVAARAAQWRPAGGSGHWDALRASSADVVECRGDRGLHGNVSGGWYAADGSRGPWSDTPAQEIDWAAAPHGSSYIFYTGNFLNYLASTGRTVESSLAQAAAVTIAGAIESTDELDVAVWRLSDGKPDAEGGFVALAPTPAALAAQAIASLLSDWPAAGPAPLAETLIEAVNWLSGNAVRYGNDPGADPAVRDPDDPARYRSPFTSPCRPVTIAVVTAGTPSQDEGAHLAARELPDFDELTGGCGTSCLPALAQWLIRSDLRSDLAGEQSADLTWLTRSPPTAVVAEALDRTGGKISFVHDPLGFANVMARSLQRDAAIAAGAQMSSPALLQAETSTRAPAAIHALSAPQASERWLGNLLRYALRAPASAFEPPVLTGRDGEPAIDPDTGLPRLQSYSAWSDAPDGDHLLDGSAAGRLPAADERRIYSDLTDDTLTSPRNRLTPGNPSLTAARLGLGQHDTETPQDVVAWLLGQRNLGDPGLHAPVIADYPADEGRTVFWVTHDGLLQAFDAGTGVERWAFLPSALLPRLPDLMRNEVTTVRGHGIDGPLVLHRHDPNGDGRIDPSNDEHLWLLFGLGRGGSGYYALDVASRDQPELLWATAPDTSGSGAQSWPEPVVARLTIGGAGQSRGGWVLFQSGGYDRDYDFLEPAASGAGASLSIREAATGRLLWRAAGDASLQPDLQVAEMTRSLASAPRVIDLDGDGYVDRLYVIDIEGALWGFDLLDGAPASALSRARLLARLGGTGQRFHSTPDVSVIHESDGPLLTISVGSGWLARPRDSSMTDRFYSIRDRQPADDPRVLHESDLHDATDSAAPMPATAAGWFVRLDSHGAGEKVIGTSVTFDHRVHLVTYQPQPALASAPCGPPPAIRRLRSLDVRTGLPAPWNRVPGDPAEHELAGSGLPPQPRFAFPRPWEGACAECRARPFGIAGTELFDAGFANDPVKTSWRRLLEEADSR